jgi:tetratricopeptide (TPR) repeat protein
MRFRWACLLCAAYIAPAHAADQLAFGPVPAWVTPQAMPASPAPNPGAPLDFLLSDTQAKLEPGTVTNYSHYALRINNAQGLGAGNVTVGWDSAFDTMTIHRVTIHRGSQSIDVLAKGQKFTTMRREQNLEQQTLNGQLTAMLQPEGLQVGDILEVELTLARRDPTFGDHMELKGAPASAMRIENTRLRLITPAKSRIRQRIAGGLPQPAVSVDGKQKISIWELSPLVPETPPAFAPSRFERGRALDISDFQSWNDLAALFLPLFEKASVIGPDSTLRPEIERIKAASADPVKRTELALQLVEEKIRYVNLALGIGGLVPATADETWARRFGDCKAKSVMLVGLLRELGIESVPVLVNTEEGDGLDEHLPMVALFNHVLVRASVAGKTYWLDGTRTGDTNLANLDVPFYYWGLPIVRNAQLVPIKPEPRTRPDFERIIHTDASAGVGKPVPTTLDLVMRGDLAILQNMIVSSVDAGLRDQALRKQLEATLDRFEVDKATGTYDPANQMYRLHGEGRQTLDLNDGIYWTQVPSPGYKADFRRTGARDTDAPVKVEYPSYNRYVQTIVLPKDRAGRAAFKVAPISATVAGVEYRRTVNNAGGVVTIEGTVRALVPEIKYADAVAAQDRLRELDKDDVWVRLSDSAPVATDEVKQLIGHEPKTSDDFMRAASKMMESGERAKAIGALDKALQIEPANVAARGLRGQYRLWAGDLEGTREDAAAVVKAEPRNWMAYSLLAEADRIEGKFDAAYAHAMAMEKIDNSTAQVGMGRTLLSLGRTNDALAAFERALSYEKDPVIHVYRAMALPAADKEGRRKELEAALKLNPSDARALTGLAEVASQIGEHAQALQLFDQAFLKSPDDLNIRNLRAIEMQLLGRTDAANREFDALAAKDLDANDLNNLCWTKALANVALDRALAECDRSLAKDDSFAAHDSKAMVLYRQSRFDDAIKEFGVALEDKERAASLYGRALAYSRKGDKAKATADAAQAVKLEPGIDRTYGYYGLGL